MDWLIPSAIVLITSAAFFPVLKNDFVNIDDRVNLLSNLYYRGLGWTQLQWMFTTLHNSLFRPITWVTFGADYLLWGLEPFGYHLTSLLFHCANALLVYRLAIRLYAIAEGNTHTQGDFSLRLGAAVAALVFAIHPLRVEVVAWASARNDVVAGLFFIATILCYMRAVRVDAPDHASSWLGAALVAYSLSLLAKPNGITLPFVLLVLDVYPLQRLGRYGKWFDSAVQRVWLEKLPFLALSMGAGVLALVAKEQSRLLADLDYYGLTERVMQSLYGLAFYLWKSIIPLALSPLYELPLQFEFADGYFLLSGVVVVTLTVVLFIYRRKWPVGMASWLIYLAILAPVSGIVQNGPQIAADRYSYLSCLPWAILAGFAMRRVWQAQARGNVAQPIFILSMTTAGLIIISFAVLTWRQTQVWRDAETLWRYALGVDENSFYAHQFLGTTLFDQHKNEEALAHFRRALAINPLRSSAHNNMGLVLAEGGDTQEAIGFYQQAIKIDPGSAIAHYNLARLLAKIGKQNDAIDHYREVLRFAPNDAKTLYNLGLLLAVKGNRTESLKYLEKAIEFNPDNAWAYYNIARIMAGQSNYPEAIRNYQAALKLNPDEAEIHTGLGDVYFRSGDIDGAVFHYGAAAKRHPESVDLHVALARLLAQQGKKEEAAKHYQAALELLNASKVEAPIQSRIK